MDVLFLLEKSRTDRFEPSNATVRWTVAGDGLTEPNLNIFFPKERKYVTNLAGTCLDDGYLKCTLITNKKRLVSTGRFLFGEIKDGQI